jgi:hypothetical protein
MAVVSRCCAGAGVLLAGHHGELADRRERDQPAINRRDGYSSGWTVIAGTTFRKKDFRPITRAVRDSVARGASPAPGLVLSGALRGREGVRLDVPVPWRQELRAPPGPPVTFRRVRAVRLCSAWTAPSRSDPDIRDHPYPVQVFGLTCAHVCLSRQNIRRYARPREFNGQGR